ncbi:MAG TPA: DUF2339 domain-containing protein, partial [Aliiroseovarius sp.]|nr:DUF2339 domain-containing protein [Aliiroseovarius sp.]
GDGADSATAFLPSVFSGAGIITLFAAILAALHLYALIGLVPALAGLVAVAVLAIVLGWYSGPLLAAIGVVGAMAAPFIVGGESETPDLLYAYFTLVTLVGMTIDAVRRWAWVTLLALVLGYGAVALLYASSGGAEGLALALTLFALAAIAVPPLSLTPRQSGAALWQMFQPGLPAGWPGFPTRVAWGAFAASAAMLALLSTENAAAFWLCIILLAALFALLAIWARHAPALEDMAAAPLTGLLAVLVLAPKTGDGVFTTFTAFATAEPGTAMPATPFILAAIGAALSAVAAWRSLWGRAKATGWPLGWAAGAALAGPLTIGTLEIWWRPGEIIGAYPWALSAAAMAILMGLIAGWFAARDGDDKRRVALAVLAALSMIAFALTLILSDAALTLALALTLLIAAVLDRRYDMRALSLFVQAGVIVIGWRLVWSPGIEWAIYANLGQMVAAFTGSIVALVWAHSFLRPLKRTAALIMLESGAFTLGAVFLSLLIYRIPGDGYSYNTHWSTGLFALVWLASSANQIWRLRAGGGRLMRGIRLILAAVFGLTGLLILAALYLFLNPLTSAAEAVTGPIVLNSLLLGFLAPALLFGFVAWRFSNLPRWMRALLIATASLMAAYWLFLAIRHAWQGPILAKRGYGQGELYSYTIAMLLTGAGLLYQAITRHSTLLRRLAMSVIALTVAKVFLIDMSGLTGLTRVFSFLALGLSLAGLAWLNRWAAGQSDQTTAPQNQDVP